MIKESGSNCREQEVQLLVLVARRYSRCCCSAAAEARGSSSKRGGVNGDNYWCQDLHLAATSSSNQDYYSAKFE